MPCPASDRSYLEDSEIPEEYFYMQLFVHEYFFFGVEKQERRCSLLFVSTANGEQVTGV